MDKRDYAHTPKKRATINKGQFAELLSHRKKIEVFEILTTEQAENLIPIDPELIALAKSRNPDDIVHEINHLIQDPTQSGDRQPHRPPPEYSKLWFPTP